MHDLASAFSVAKDLVTAAVAIVGIGVAVRGLGTWGRQLRGGAEYELARRLLKQAYELREEMNHCRRPFMLAHEMPPLADESLVVDDQAMVMHRRWAAGYEARLSRVAQARVAVDASLLEGEVLWGSDVRESWYELLHLQDQLGKWILLTVRSNHPDDAKVSGILKLELERMGNVQLPLVKGGEDLFGNLMRGGIKKIEDFLRPHLNRNLGIQTSIIEDLLDVFRSPQKRKS